MLKEACEQITEQLIKWRREFHQYPELSFEEKHTSKLIAAFLKERGLKVTENVFGYGIIADLEGNFPGPTVALRADMDALPIVEQTNLPFASKHNGVMHACGHDGHMAALMGAVEILSKRKDKIKGKIRFIFQPGEELTPGGAKGMIEAGALAGVDVIYGLHLWSELPTGTFHTTLGPMMAASDKFTIEINGKGGHGGLPHKTVDSLVIASQLVTLAQQIVSRKIDPIESGVLTFGKLHSGTAFNVIADKAVIEGTARSFAPQVRDQLQIDLEKLAHSITDLNGADVDVRYERGYPPLINHKNEALTFMEAAKSVFGEENTYIMPPNMAGEDFAYYLEKVPGSFCFVGAAPMDKSIFPHHHPKFDFEEKSLPIATELLCQIALNYTS
ncbi:M20 metallopeptidase family protein [Bacillus sp. Marseille-P3661]|uniref:M20 metallopeptidase family protein n=1 Tax=Bacillus sp. Marseille-P3661 TaxID=1936234 RepID=UPI000C84823B|nr:amidohydrolase [Bacillus sp. Marseille-P3661]